MEDENAPKNLTEEKLCVLEGIVSNMIWAIYYNTVINEISYAMHFILSKEMLEELDEKGYWIESVWSHYVEEDGYWHPGMGEEGSKREYKCYIHLKSMEMCYKMPF